MKITGFHIDGFGPFCDAGVEELPEGLIVFEGVNEAGKSSLLEFFRVILFGLPKAKWRPALAGGRHGGRLMLAVSSGAAFVLERHATAPNAPVLRAEDGAPAGSDWTRVCDVPVSPDLFRNVFAFGQDEFESAALLDGTAMEGILYDASMGVPVSRLQAARRDLAEERKDWLKKRGDGRINRLVRDWDEAEAEAERDGPTIPRHEALATRQAAETERLAELCAEESLLRGRLVELDALARGLPAWRTYLAARARPPVGPFPEDGVARHETLLQTLDRARRQHADRKDTTDKYRQDLAGLGTAPEYLAFAADIRALAGERARLLDTLEMLPRLDRDAQAAQHEAEAQLARLGPDWSPARVRTLCGASIPDRDRFEQAARASADAVARCEGTARDVAEKTAACAAIQAQIAPADAAGAAACPADVIADCRARALRLRVASADMTPLAARLDFLDRRLETCRAPVHGAPDAEALLERLVADPGTEAQLMRWRDRLHDAARQTEASATHRSACDAALADAQREADRWTAQVPAGCETLTAAEAESRAQICREQYLAADRGLSVTARAWLWRGGWFILAAGAAALGAAYAFASVPTAVLGGILLVMAAFPLVASRTSATSDQESLQTAWRDAEAVRSILLRKQEAEDRKAEKDTHRAAAQAAHEATTQAQARLEAEWTTWRDAFFGCTLTLSPDDVLARVLPAARESHVLLAERTRVRQTMDDCARLTEGLAGLLRQHGITIAADADAATLAARAETFATEADAARAKAEEAARRAPLLREARSALEAAVARKTEADTARAEQDAAWQALLGEWDLPPAMTPATAAAAAECLARAHAALERQERVLRERQAAQDIVATVRTETARLAQAMSMETPAATASLPEFIDRMIRTLNDDLHRASAREALLPVLDECVRQEQQAAAEIARLEEAIRDLYREAGVCDRAAFLARAAALQDDRQTRQRMDEALCALRHLFGTDDEKRLEALFTAPDALRHEAGIADVHARLEVLSKDIAAGRETLGRLGAEATALETDGRPAELRQSLESIAGAARAAWTEWAVATLAETLIDRACRVFERERQPEALRRASAHFSAMTAGRYRRVFAPVEERRTFRVEDAAGRLKEVSHLSRGTREQLLCAIRFGYVETAAHDHEPLPLILDDIWANADPGRRDAAVQRLSDMARERQILFFTCHPATRDAFLLHGGATIITLQNGRFHRSGATT